MKMAMQSSQGDAPTASAPGQVKFLKRGLFQRLRGKCATSEPYDPDAWTYSSGRILLDLNRTPELWKLGGAIRLEGKGLPHRVLIVRSQENEFHAFLNSCTHFGRRLDPVPDTDTVQCCSMGKSTFDLAGRKIFGPAKQALVRFAIETESAKLVISLV